MASQQGPAKVWATANFNKTEVMVGEPLVVTITVYTSTWFTKPPIFEEIQVKGALMTRLEQRNSARSVTIGRKIYPAIEQKFVVYPNAIGKNTLPPFKITISSPREGDYKGQERVVYTKERSFEVLPPPEEAEQSKWLAAYKVSLTEVWNRTFDSLKVGDLLERRIIIKASGALAAAIPPVDISNIDFGTIYPKPPSLINYQNRASFTGTRTEILSYLVEKDGSFKIPEVSIPWYNLNTKKMEYETIDSINISIAPNKDMAFILTRQKELQEALASEQEEVLPEEEGFQLFGLNWWQLTLVGLSILALIKLLFEGIKRLKLINDIKREKKRNSEEHYLDLLRNSFQKGEKHEVIKNLFFWYDRFRENRLGPEFGDFVKASQNQKFEEEIEDLSEETYKGSDEGKLPSDLYASIKKGRESITKEASIRKQKEWYKINP